MKEYKKTVTLQVFAGYKVTIIFTDDVNGSFRRHWKQEPGKPNGAARHVTDGNRSWVYLNSNADEVHTWAHESVHVAYAVLAHISAEQVDEEIVAYLTDHVVEAISDLKREMFMKIAKEAQTKRAK